MFAKLYKNNLEEIINAQVCLKVNDGLFEPLSDLTWSEVFGR